MSSYSLTVVVLTHNEEANLPACLQSLRGLDFSLFVVDSGSTDRTVEIAQSYGARVARHPFEHYAAQRNWAQAQLPSTCDWVLHLDADERLTPALSTEIQGCLQSPASAAVDGYLLRKRTVFMGRWIKHGGHYPSYHLRLFRPQKGRCEDRLYDQHFVVDGRVNRLRNDYLDVICSDLLVWTSRHARWAELEARETLAGSRDGLRVEGSLLGTPIQRKRWLRNSVYGRAPLFGRAFAYWLYRYLLRGGFLDGREGLIFHFLQGCWYRFMVDVKLDELRRGEHATPITSGSDSQDTSPS